MLKEWPAISKTVNSQLACCQVLPTHTLCMKERDHTHTVHEGKGPHTGPCLLTC
jgi:hypothetical protein